MPFKPFGPHWGREQNEYNRLEKLEVKKTKHGTEGQAIYEGEDRGWRLRLFWALLNGGQLIRQNSNLLANMTKSLLIMDSRGYFDILTTNDSMMLSMSNTRTGMEMHHV